MNKKQSTRTWRHWSGSSHRVCRHSVLAVRRRGTPADRAAAWAGAPVHSGLSSFESVVVVPPRSEISIRVSRGSPNSPQPMSIDYSTRRRRMAPEYRDTLATYGLSMPSPRTDVGVADVRSIPWGGVSVSVRRLWSHDIKFLAELNSPSRARDFVRSRLAAHDLPLLMDDIALVVSELATNAVLHAQTPFTVALHASQHTVLLEVEDGSQLGPLRVDGQVLDISGRGMGIVNQLSRDWGVDKRVNSGKTVWAQFDRVPR